MHELFAEYDQVYFAYFAPFSNDRHLDLLAKCASSEVCSVRSLGQSLGMCMKTPLRAELNATETI